MKKILYILAFFGLFTIIACEPNEDILEELDEDNKEVVEEFNYKVTTDDYELISKTVSADAVGEDILKANAIASQNAFNTTFTAQDLVPILLNANYDFLGRKSKVQVTYDQFIGGIEYLDNFSDADSYTLIPEDYDSMGEEKGEPGKYDNFSSSILPDDYLPDFLGVKFPEAKEGKMVLVQYKYYAGSVSDKERFYFFNGIKWSSVDAYVLTESDYDSMGAPGNHDNFSSSVKSDFYIPIFLKNKYPYVLKGEKVVVVYKYYEDGDTKVLADEYHFNGTEWKKYDAIETYTKQFVHNGEEWVFDPTLTIVMSKSDYQLIVDYVLATFGDEFLPYSNTDNYYGASAYHGNFDGRPNKWNDEVFETWQDAAIEGIRMGFLPVSVPDAVSTKYGVDMYYVVRFGAFTGSNSTHEAKYHVTKTDPAPEFEYVDGSFITL